MTGFNRIRPFRPLGYIISLFCVLQLAVSAPHREKRAAPSCTNEVGTANTLTYEAGKTYNYDFESEIITKIVGGSDEDSRLKVKGQAALAVLSSCEQVLTVLKLDLVTPSQQADGLKAIEKTSLKFTNQNGKLDPESITLSKDDPVWSANIKRAIVSSFQNHALGETGVSSLTFRESDITGSDCLTKYTITGSTYVRTRDLNLCAKRDGGIWAAQGVPYPAHKPRVTHSDPTLKSSQTCTQDYSSGKLQSVTCTETHKLEILNKGGAGAQTTVTTSLKLTGDQGGATPFDGTKSSCLAYDHSDDSDTKLDPAAANVARKILDELCSDVSGGILGNKVAGLLLDLKRQISRTAVADLRAIYADVTSGKVCSGGAETEKVKVLYEDTAASAGTTSAIEFVAKLYDSLDERVQGLFRLSLAFAKGPEASALESVATLISPSSDSRLLIAASGLGHQYCLLTNKDCGNNAAYNSISDAIAVQAKANCLKSDEPSVRNAIAALQALGNLDSLSKSAVSTIGDCLKGSEPRVLAHAWQSFRRDACEEGLKAKARDTLNDDKVSTDLRIQAYLAIANCLTEDDSRFISSVLKGPSNQVYWFIASHRHNWLHTDSQRKVKSPRRHAFSLISVPKASSKPDARKYSVNYDLSTFDRRSNLGGTFSGNLIYSQDSFIPRAISSDVTIDVYGRSYDILEAGIGLADFEDVAERFYKATQSEDADAGADSGRSKREVPKPSFQAKDVNALQQQTKVDVLHKTNGVSDVYFRVFGTTVCVNSYVLDELLEEGAEVQAHFLERLQKALSSSKLDLTQGLPFLDDELIVPTVSGFPLSIEIEKTAVVSFKFTGDLGKDGSIKTRLAPSGSVQTRGKMIAGTGPVQAGLQVEFTVHSASDVAAQFTTVPGKTKGFNCDLKINLPQDKTHLFDVRSELFWVTRTGHDAPTKKAVTSKLPQKIVVENFCLDTVSQFFGRKYCVEVKLPQLGGGEVPIFPLTGPLVGSVTAEKSDPSITDYLLQLHFDNDENADMHISLVFDTPGAAKSRRIVLTATGVGARGSSEKTLDLIIESPWKKLNGKGKYTKTPKDKGVTTRTATFNVKADDTKTLLDVTYSGDYADKGSSFLSTYLPLRSSLDLDAKYGMEAQHSLTINTKCENPTISDLSFQAKVASSRLPPLNFDINWDRSISWQKLKLNFDINQGLGADKNAISFHSQTELGDKAIDSKTEITVNIPAKKLDITWSSNANFDKVKLKATGGLTLKAQPIADAASSFNLDLVGQSYDFQATASVADKKISLKSAGTKSEGADGRIREYSLQLNVEPKVFDLDVKTTVRVIPVGALNKFQFQTTATTSLIPTPVSTTLEVTVGGGILPKKASAQLNLGNDRVASSSFELIQSADSIGVVVESFIQKRLNGKFEANVGFGSTSPVSTKVDFTYIPLGRRIKLEGNARAIIDAGTTGLHYDSNIQWDFDKDPKKGVSVSVDNTFNTASSRFVSSNTVTYSGTPYKVIFDYQPGNSFLNEDHSWKLSYQSGSGPAHKVGFLFRADNTDTAKKLTVSAQLDLDSVPSVPSEIKLEVGLTDLNTVNLYFDSLSRLAITPKGKSANIVEIEFGTKASKRGRSFRAEVRDDLIYLYGIDATADVGSDGVDFKYERSLTGKKTTLVEVIVSRGTKGKLSEVKTTAIYDKDFSADGPNFKIDGSYLYRLTSLWDFEVTEQYTISDRTQAAPKSVDSLTVVNISPTSFLVQTNSAIKAPGLNWDEKADFEIKGNLDGKKFSGSLDAKFTNNSVEVQMVKAEVGVTPGFPHDSELSFSIALPPVVKYRNVVLKIKHDEVSKGSYLNVLQAKINDVNVELTSTVEFGAKSSGDFALKIGKDPVRKLTLSYHDSADGKVVDATIRWGDDSQVISTTGKVIPKGEGFDVLLVFDSALLPNKKWELSISRTIEATKRGLTVSLDNAESKQNLKFGVEKIQMGDAVKKYNLFYDANLSLPALRGLLQGQNGQIVVEINKKAFDPAKEKAGIEVKVDANAGVLALNVQAKKSDLKGKISVSLCPGPGLCTTADALLIQDTNSFQASADIVRKGIKVGFTAENKKTDDGKSCDTNGKLFYPLGGQQKELGLRVYSADGQDSDVALSKKEIGSAPTTVRKCGIEVTLGPRTISSAVSRGNWDSDAADADAAEVRIWLDKSRDADKVLAISLFNIAAGDGKQGRDVGAILSHPDFTKDHKIKSSYRFDSAGENLFNIKTELDIFKTTQDALIKTTSLKQKAAGDSTVFQIEHSIKSVGQGLSWEFVCNNIKIDGDERTFNCKFDGKSATRGDRSGTWDFSSDFDSIKSELVDNDGLVLKFNSGPKPGTKEIVTTFQVPGMTESWVREIRENKDPAGIAYRGYGSSYPADKYSEAYLGIFSSSKFGGGVRSSDGSAKTDLTTQTLEIRSPDPDILRINWNKDAIKKFLDDTNARSDVVSKGMIEFARKRGNNNAERLQQIVDGFKGALPDPSPLLRRVTDVVNELAREGGGATQGLISFASRSKRAAGDDKKIQAALTSVTDSVVKSLEAVAESRRSAINKVKALLDQISTWPASESAIEGMRAPIKDSLQKGLGAAHAANLKVQSLETGLMATVLQKARGVLLDTFEDAFDENLANWNRAFPYPDVEQFLNSLPEYLESVMLKPNETTDGQRRDIYEKLDRAILQVASKAFSADFQKGTIVSHIPIASLVGLGRLDEDDFDPDSQAYPTVSILNIIIGLLSPRRVLPPVEAVGVVIEGTHFQTFDGYLKYFGNACQYLLATDANKKFAVIIDVQKKGATTTQSVIVTDGTDTIVISGSPTIYANGKKTDPTTIGAFTIKQDKKWTQVTGKMGVTVTCLKSEEKQVCEIKASGFYHGKLRGILGRFDNESFDDKTTPSGSIASTPDFIKSWQLDQNCKGAKTNDALSDYKRYVKILDNDDLNLVKA